MIIINLINLLANLKKLKISSSNLYYYLDLTKYFDKI
jgi:hypothetical protein